MVGNLITSTMIALLQVQPIQMGHKVYGLLHAMLGALTLDVLTVCIGKLRADSNSLSSWKEFTLWRTTKPFDARKYKPHRPWNLPLCHKSSGMLQTRSMNWDTLERSFVSFCTGCFTGSLSSSLGGKADVVKAEIMHPLAFAMNHLAQSQEEFFCLSQKVYWFSCVALLDCVWLTSSSARKKAGCPIKYQTSLKTINIYSSISDQPVSVVKTQL